MAVKNRDIVFLVKVQNMAKAALAQLRTDLQAVATAANNGNTAAVTMEGGTNRIAKAANSAATAIRNNQTAINGLSDAQTKAAINAEKLAQAQARTAEAQSKANIAYLREEEALNRAVTAEGKAIASKERLAAASVAAAKASETTAATAIQRATKINSPGGNGYINPANSKFAQPQVSPAENLSGVVESAGAAAVANEFGGAKDADDLAKKVAALRAEVDPLGASYQQLTAKQQLWTAALDKGLVSDTEYQAATLKIADAIGKLEDTSALEKQAAAAGMTSKEFVALQQRVASLRKEYDPLATATATYKSKLDDLEKAKTAGILTDTEHAAATTKLAKQFEDLEKAATKGAHGVGVSSNAMREGVVVIHELMRGDMTRLPGSLSILGSNLGLLTAETLPLIAGFGAVAVAIGVLSAAVITGSNDQARLQNMLSITNNSAGLTYTSFVNLSEGVAASANISQGAAEKITAAFVSTGKLSQPAISDLSTSAVEFAHLTGQSVDDVVKSWSKIGDDPIKFANELADKYNLVNDSGQGLSATNIQLAQRLLETGDRMGAINAIAADVKAGLADQVENVGYLTTAWRTLASSIGDAWHALQDWGKADTPLQAAQKRLADLQSQKKSGIDAGAFSDAMSGGVGVGTGAGGASIDAAIAAQQKIVDGLKKADDAKAASAAALAKQQSDARDSYTAADSTYKQMIDRTVQYNDQLKLLAQRQAAANAEVTRLKGTKGTTAAQLQTAQDNANFYNDPNSHAKIVASLRKQYLPATTKDDKDAETAAKKAAAEEKQFENQLKSMETTYAPVIAKQEQYAKNMALITRAHAEGKLTGDAYTAVLGNLQEAMGTDSDAIGKTVRTLNEQMTVTDQSIGQREAFTQVMSLQNQMLKEGTAVMKDGQFVIQGTTLLTQKQMQARYDAAKAVIAYSVAEKALQAANDNNTATSTDNAVDTAALKMPLDIADAWAKAEKARQAFVRAGADPAKAASTEAVTMANANTTATNASLRASRLQDQDNQDSHAGDQLVGWASERAVDLAKERSALVRSGITDENDLTKALTAQGDVLDKEHARQLAAQADWGTGLKKGLSDWMVSASDIAKQSADLVTQSMDNLASMFATFAETGKLKFKDFVTSTLGLLTQLVTKMLLVKAIGSVFPGLLSAGTLHTGGMVGNATSAAKSVPSSVFLGARRFHSGGMIGGGDTKLPGLKSNEEPIIALKTERVLNPEETKAYNAGLAASGALAMATPTKVARAANGASQLVFSPTFATTFASGGGSNDNSSGLDSKQMAEIQKGFKNDATEFMEKWVQNEQRPGGRLASTRR